MMVRRLTEQEWPQVLSMAERNHFPYGAKSDPAGQAEVLTAIRERACRGEPVLYGAFREETLVGALATGQQGNRVVFLLADASAQERGCGRALLEHAFTKAQGGWICVDAPGEAVAFYEQMGLRKTGPERQEQGQTVTPMAAELLDVVDEQGNPTGHVVARELAHGEAIRHRTSHVWLVRKHHGVLQVLLQKRCSTKDSWPGCYDISSAGHIPAGVDFVPSALRELEEELGVTATAGELHVCGTRYITMDGFFHGKPFYDRQVSRVFCLYRQADEASYTPQPSEIESVLWMDLEQCIDAVLNNAIPNCIYPEELEMVRKTALTLPMTE